MHRIAQRAIAQHGRTHQHDHMQPLAALRHTFTSFIDVQFFSLSNCHFHTMYFIKTRVPGPGVAASE